MRESYFVRLNITRKHLVIVTNSTGDKYQRIQPFFLVSVTNTI